MSACRTKEVLEKTPRNQKAGTAVVKWGTKIYRAIEGSRGRHGKEENTCS